MTKLRSGAFALVVGLSLSQSLVISTGAAYAGNSFYYNGLAEHWNRSGTALAQVYFVDHTGYRWPVNASVLTWNQSSRVKSYYQTSCPNTSLHCVDAYEYSALDGNLGYTQFQVPPSDSNGHLISYVDVYFNNAYPVNPTDDRQTVCQELGHALGLDHNPDSASCMSASSSNMQYPTSHDFAQLAAVYNH